MIRQYIDDGDPMGTRQGWVRRIATAGGCVAIALLSGSCRDITSPLMEKLRIVGTYDLTTTLQTHSYSTTCGTYSCTGTTEPAGPARLYGTLTIEDTAVAKGSDIALPLYSALVHQTPCAAISPPCTAVVGERVINYRWFGGPLTVTGDTMAVSGAFYGEMMITINGRFAGDSIVGDLTWSTYLGSRAWNEYSGPFVARRQR